MSAVPPVGDSPHRNQHQHRRHDQKHRSTLLFDHQRVRQLLRPHLRPSLWVKKGKHDHLPPNPIHHHKLEHLRCHNLFHQKERNAWFQFGHFHCDFSHKPRLISGLLGVHKNNWGISRKCFAESWGDCNSAIGNQCKRNWNYCDSVQSQTMPKVRNKCKTIHSKSVPIISHECHRIGFALHNTTSSTPQSLGMANQNNLKNFKRNQEFSPKYRLGFWYFDSKLTLGRLQKFDCLII